MKSRKYLFIGVSICLMLLLSIGVSYSMWRQTLVGTSSIVATTNCFDVSITSEENAISLGDDAIVKADYIGKAKTPYTFTIKNTCNVKATYSVNLILFSTTTDGTDKTLDEQYVKAYLQGNDKETLSIVSKLDSLSNDVMVNDMKITASNLKSGYVLTSDVIGANESVTYNLNLWIDNSSEEELSSNLINDKVFNAKIYIKSEPTNNDSTIIKSETNDVLLTSAILRNNESKGTADLTTAPTDETSGIYEAEDDYGISYYFRGTNISTNNHVIFGTDSSGNQICWRIIRINGDGTVRIMYNGITTDDTCSTDYTDIGFSVFNSQDDDNAYAGYMFGSTGAETYAETHANENSSTIKGVLDEWYVDNLLGYENFIADNGFCNDRSIDIETYKGYGTNYTVYEAGVRLMEATPKPSLRCTQNNDFFTTGTVETKTSGITGNGKLTYPIGLITADELVFGGTRGKLDDLESFGSCQEWESWLIKKSGGYWSMTPYYHGGPMYSYILTECALRGVNVDGATYYRPVISLSKNVMATGYGTESEPYKISNGMDLKYKVLIDSENIIDADVYFLGMSVDSILVRIKPKDNYYFETAPTVSIANGTAVIGEITEDSSGYTVTITNITSDITLSISGTAKIKWTEIAGTSITTETIADYTVTLDVSNLGIENVEKYIFFGVYDNNDGNGSFVVYIDDSTNNILNGTSITLQDDSGNSYTPSATTDTGSGYQYIWSITSTSDMNLTITLS